MGVSVRDWTWACLCDQGDLGAESGGDGIGGGICAALDEGCRWESAGNSRAVEVETSYWRCCGGIAGCGDFVLRAFYKSSRAMGCDANLFHVCPTRDRRG